jgi:hypothetical protein
VPESGAIPLAFKLKEKHRDGSRVVKRYLPSVGPVASFATAQLVLS